MAKETVRRCSEPGCTRKAIKKGVRCRKCYCRHYGIPYTTAELKALKPHRYQHKRQHNKEYLRQPEVRKRCLDSKRRSLTNQSPEAKRQRKAYLAALTIKKNAIIRDLKSSGCLCCPELDPACLAYHHRPGEKKISSVSALRNGSTKRVLAEIAKCDLLCANCHAKIHNPGLPARQPYRQTKRLLLEQRKSGGCLRCGLRDYRCLTFHHRTNNKLDSIANLLAGKLSIFLAELEKCDVLCFNCHMKLHFGAKAKTSEASNETIRQAVEPSSA